MICIYQNSRGLTNSPSRLSLKNMIMSNKLDLLFIVKPWMSLDKIPQNWFLKLGFKLIVINERFNLMSNMWYFYKC
ncbi:unnamed protein product [Lathyrus sativus]|nr:unnamed protein product [Lathyrus sativus]